MRRWGLVSDIHFNDRSLPRVIETAQWICAEFARQRVTHIVVCGDVLNTRDAVSVPCLTAAMMWFRDLINVAPTSVITGNHDMHLRDTGRMTSLDALEYVADQHCVRLFRSPSLSRIQEAPCAFFPYSQDSAPLSLFSQSIAGETRFRTVAFAHAEIPGARISKMIVPSQSASMAAVYLDRLFEGDTDGATKGHFLDGFRWAFSGHFHIHQTVRDRVTYVGAPLQHHFGDAGDSRGILIYDYDNNHFERVLNPEWDQFRHVLVQSGTDLSDDVTKELRGKSVLALLATYEVDRTQVMQELQKAGASLVRTQNLWIPKLMSPATSAEDMVREYEPATNLRQDKWFMAMVPRYVAQAGSDLPPSVSALFVQTGVTVFKSLLREVGETVPESRSDKSFKTSAFRASLKAIRMENFMSVKGTQSLDFSAGGNMLWMIVGSNGAGKSLLLEAVSWCLFGRVLRSDMLAPDVVNDSCPKDSQCSVTVYFDNELSVCRSRSKSGKVVLRVFQGGRELEHYSKGTVAASDAAVSKELLGVDFDTFARCVVVSDTVLASFLSQGSQKDRVGFMERILGMDELDGALSVIRQLSKDLELRISNLEKSIAISTDQLRQLAFRIHAAEIDSTHASHELVALRHELDELEEQRRVLEDLVAAEPGANTVHDDLHDILPWSHPELSEGEKGTAVIRAESDALHSSNVAMKLLQAFDSSILPSFERFNSLFGTFSLHLQSGTSSSAIGASVTLHSRQLQQEVSYLRMELTREASATKFQSETSSAKITLGHNGATVAAGKKVTEQTLRMPDDVRERKLQFKKYSEIMQKIAGVQTKIALREATLSTANASKEACGAQIGTLQQQLTDMQSSLQPLVTQRPAMEFWETALGRGRKVKNPGSTRPISTFRAFLLEQTVDSLNQLLREHSAQLFRNGTLDLEIQLDASLSIIGDYGKRSNGQRKRFDLCVLFALFEVMRQNSAFQPAFLMLDEIFDSLDTQGQRNTIEVLQVLSQRFGNIFVVSHADVFKNIQSASTRQIDVEFTPSRGTEFHIRQ